MQEQKVYELTNPQKSILFTEQYFANTAINNICGTAIIKEKVNINLLKRAIILVMENNDIFKIKLMMKEDGVVQYVSDSINDDIIFINAKNNTELSKKREEIVSKNFKLLDSFLYDFYIFKMPNNNAAFMLNIHHLLADSWTLAFICNEIIQTYSSLVKNETLENNTYSYIDYIYTEQEYLSSPKFQKDKSYWVEKFQNIPEIATIPASKKTQYEPSIIAKRTQFNLDKKIVSEIKDYCTKNKISLYNFFMAIYAIYISEISNINDFVIGTPILNRSNFKEKHTAGMFINVAPFRININSSLSFNTFVKNIAVDSLNMLRHQKYSYQQLLEDLREKDKNTPNLYKILFSYQITNAKNNTGSIDYSTEWTFNGYCAEDMDIQIFDINDTGSLNVSYDYKIDLYNDEDIKDIHERILNIINQVISNEDINLQDVEIVTPKEKEQLLYDFNNTELKYDENKTVVKHFEEYATKNPNKIALISNGKKFTYEELNRRANQIAHNLILNNVKENDIIAIMVNRSPEMIMGLIAILKCGATYLPIDPEYPIDRILYMLENSETKTILVNSQTTNLIPKDKNCKKINIELINKTELKDEENIGLKLSPQSVAYLIYTSGSTGKPKGIRVTNKNLTNFINAMKKLIDFNERKTMVSVTTMCFDIFGLELWCSLSSGQTLVLANEQEQDTPALLNKLCLENNVNIIQTTPSRFSVIFEEEENLQFLKNVTDILVGGEALNSKLLSNMKKYSRANIYNVYGPTETTIWSTLKDLTYTEEITIGKPIANTQCYILNNNHKLLPPNTPGELYIGGDGVSNGYLKREELNNEKFIKSPFNKNAKIYNTNDLAYFNKGGEIVHLGRTDFQVKIRGFRVELGEIENIIEKQEIISKCVVTKKQLPNLQEVLVAYYITKKDTDIQKLNKKLKSILSAELPQYMVPQYFINIEKIPYTPNGKVQIQALPIPAPELATREVVKPRNKLDKKLVEIVSKILHIENISIEDTLLGLGGDSLTAITLSTKILSKFNVQINIKDILSNYTIKDMSDYIKKAKPSKKSIQIPKAEKQSLYPLSSAQSRIYYNSKMISDSNTVYNLPGAIIADKVLNADKVKDVFYKIIQRHSALRTAFVLYNGTVMQKVEENLEFDIPVYENTESEIPVLLNNFSKPFDLEKAPLIRAEIHYIDNKKTLLLLEAHHSIIDGTGLNNLIIEFNRLYNGEKLEKIPIQYTDYAVWENKYNASENIKNCEEYWLNKFSDCDFARLNLPYDYTHLEERSYKGEKITKVIDEEYFNKIEKFAKQLGVSPYVFFLSVFFIILYKYTGQSDINIGSPIANRDIEETKKMIGMFVNNIVVRGKINTNKTFKEFLEEVKEQVFEDMSNQPYPYDMLVKKLNMANSSLFDVMFTYQNKEENIIKIGDLSCEILEIKNDISKFNLSLEIKPTTHTINIEYCSDLFKRKTIETLFNSYMNAIDCISQKIDISIKDISIVSKEEKDVILYKFNDTSKKIDLSKTIIELFEEQAKINPDNIAVIFENKKMSYKELNEKANAVAWYLNSNKVNKDDIISIRMNRSLNLIIAVIGVLKSGASYILIDPSLPEERVSYMIKNAKSKILLTQKELFNLMQLDVKSINIEDLDYEKYSKKDLKDIERTEDLCILYTSGSTGKPKGVSLTKRGFTNLMYAFDDDMDISKYKTILGIATVAFDMFAVELYSALSFGHTLILANEEEQKNAIAMSNLIKKYNVEFFVTTPSRVELLLLEECKNPLKDVKCFQLGGEEFSPTLQEKLSKYTNAKVYNGYGPTEISACCSNKLVTDTNITIGKPLDNVKIYICTEDMNLCPIGVAGEICVGGFGVSNGYINNPEMTSKVFVKNPENPSEILYKTGDLGRYNESGEIEYIGRKDDQIKIRGLRIELPEIESRLNQIDEVEKSCVLYIKNAKSPYLIAFVTSKDNINVHKIKLELAKKLPEYMIPRYIVQIEEFPVTLNGKIDKRTLEQYAKSNSLSLENDISLPETETEKLFCNIWSSLLNTTVGIDDNLFDIGADSLLAINFKAQLLSYNIDLPYADIFKYKTIRMIAKEYDSKKDQNYQSDLTINTEEADYTKINEVLYSQNADIVERKTDNNVLLLGGTGFVGMHIIDSFIKNSTGKIYCIVREKNKQSALERFIDILHYYFNNKLDKYIDKRIFVINGNVVKENFGVSNTTYEMLSQNVDVVINSAANVKHYGNTNAFLNININTINTVIDFCEKYNKRLLHISSLSVSGNMILDGGAALNKKTLSNNDLSFTEKDLYIGQTLENVYTKSKFDGEKIILDNIIENGLNAQILRLGNITNRYSDGKFQINYKDNAFVNRIKSFIDLKMFPDYLLKDYAEFTPVDVCADAIISVLNNNYTNMYIYHIYNNNHIYFSQLFEILQKLDIDISIVDNAAFKGRIQELAKKSSSANALSGIVNDFDHNKKLSYSSNVKIFNDITNNILAENGFEWPEIDFSYIEKYLDYFKQIKFFE